MDVFVLAGLGRGRCLAQLGSDEESWAALDEIMSHVVGGARPAGGGSGLLLGDAMCLDRYELRRAQEWTQALTEWIADQQGLVPYRGTCLVHRAEILQLHGAWSEAAVEAGSACDRLAESGEPGLGLGHYRIGELARLRGDLHWRSGRSSRPPSWAARSARPGPAASRAGSTGGRRGGTGPGAD